MVLVSARSGELSGKLELFGNIAAYAAGKVDKNKDARIFVLEFI